MKYIYTGGPYTEFRGYVFINGKPTTISDRGTLEAIAKRPDFKPYPQPVVEGVPTRKKLTLPKKAAI